MGQALEDINSQRTLASALLTQTGECTNDQCDRLFLTRPHKIALLPEDYSLGELWQKNLLGGRPAR
ncbi:MULTISPECIES: hypothetical protein [unclassified Nostoc]|uniref:hypothetical protein n=1 Tax=unclassified Nostoc TaxID=2593658 RepID=UPI0013F7F14E|nr:MULTISPECIES: hypothetical protein [unclassified Nostoc]MBE8997013.1 hypothetical protein [Nostoc sp. LEGE 12447]NEU81805.1 hypothetical protein [Nostoc sp. UIC 10630]